MGLLCAIIVFIHLGPGLPKCLPTVIEQARYMNKGSPIYLLTENRPAEELGVTWVDVGKIPMSEEHRAFHSVNKISKSSSDGLWFYALMRFFVLYDFMKEYAMEHVVHLENDSMLYVDVEELSQGLEGCQMAAPFQSRAACIPAFVYVKDAASLQYFAQDVLQQMEQCHAAHPEMYVNDMRALASFYKRFGDAYLTPLPTLMPGYGKRYPKRRSIAAEDNQTKLQFLSMHGEKFPGYLFDAAGLGIWINGSDRKYAPLSGPGTFHSRVLFYPHFFTFFWGEDRESRAVPYLSFQGVDYRVANLHFHSKFPEEYASFNQNRKPL